MMFKYFTSGLLFLFITILGGCATAPIPKISFNGIKTLGVVSVCGGTITRESWGMIVFDNDFTYGDISDWKLDDFIFDTVKKLGPQFTVQKIVVDPGNLNSGEPSREGISVEDRLKTMLISAQPNVDAYLIISRGVGMAPSGNPSDTTNGMGIFSHGLWRFVHASCDVTLVDGRTGKRLGSSLTSGILRIPSELRHDKWEDYNGEEKKIILDDLKKTIEVGFKESLSSMNNDK